MANKLQAGDIYLVRFHPSYGAEFQKYRPAVVVSTAIIDPRFVLIAPFSTNLHVLNPDYEFIVRAGATLQKDSVLLSWYLWTIDTRRLVKKLGTLGDKDKKRLYTCLTTLLTS